MRAPVAAAILTSLASLTGCGTRPPPGLIGDGGVVNVKNVCQHTCTPDPGPRPMTQDECNRATAGLEFMNPFVSNFEGNLATNLHSYTDGTGVISTFFTDPMTKTMRKTWEPPTDTMDRCGNPNNKVIHVQGGPFLGWGGGIGVSMQKYRGLGDPVTVEKAILDAHEWEGISFWARRGPDSQNGFRVLAGDKNTDDDIAYLMYRDDPTVPRFCERVRECACMNHMACKEVADPGHDPVAKVPGECLWAHPFPPNLQRDQQPPTSFCGKPEVLGAQGAMGSSGYVACNTCEKSRCDEPYPAYPDDFAKPGGTSSTPMTDPQGVDRQFFGKACTPHIFRNGVSSTFCFDAAAGDTVAEPDQQCGDHWTKTVPLGTDWQFYTVPFNQMGQQGWAKKFAALDSSAITLVRFTWDGGWVDYYIDDVAFYRHVK